MTLNGNTPNGEIQLARLYDGGGNIVTEWNPRFEAVRREREILFGAGGYNPVAERRGRAKAAGGSENWIANRDRVKAMADARDAFTFDWIGGVIAKVVLYVCGRLHAKSATGEGQIDQMYDDYFHGWCGDERDAQGLPRCDFSGRHRFLKQVQLAFMSFLVDGDHGLLEINPEFSPNGEFCLQNIEADRIGSPMEGSIAEDYIGGVKIDPMTGRVQFYRIFQRTRTNQYINPQEVPPESFIHVFDPDHGDEYRGRTKLLRILNDLRDIREWIEAEKIAGKTQSQYAALIGTKDPMSGQGASAWSDKTAEGTPTQTAQWGKLLKLAEGENFSMLSPAARPSGAFMQFVDTLIRKMGVSLNLPYGFLWDLATLGGVTARIEVQSALRQIQYWQDNILVGLILDRVRQKVIAQGIAMQMLPAHPLWKKCSWNFGQWITTDQGYEMSSDLEGLGAGILRIDSVTGKYGTTPREVLTSNASAANDALGVGAEHALPVETFARGLWPDITNQKAAFLAQTPIPSPPPGSFEAIGDKGVAKMVEIAQSVKEGTMDRESAIAMMRTAFGFTPKQADALVPDEPTPAEANRAAGLDVKGNHPKPAAAKTSSSNGSRKPARK